MYEWLDFGSQKKSPKKSHFASTIFISIFINIPIIG